VTVLRENTGEGNGCTLDRQCRLIMCEGADHRRITRMEADGTITAIAERWLGKRFNKPNDVVCRSDGSIFFTDPGLRLPAELREIGFSGVFRIDPSGHLHLATDECEYPNGLAFSPDESVLYVAISRLDERCFQESERGEVCTHRRIRAFDVAPDGTLTNNRVFCDMSSADPGVPDGIKVDTKGRVFCVGSGGIWVIAPSGEVIGIVQLPEVARNLAFGGPDFRTLYLTPRDSLMKLQVKTPGIGAFRYGR
jgi:gluconolactonase